MSFNNSRSKATIKSHPIDKWFKYYLLTIAKHQVKDYVDKSDLDQAMVSLKLKHDSLNILSKTYEISKLYKQLHLHAIVSIPYSIHYKTNNSFDGFRFQWKPVYDFKGAFKYIYKDSCNQYEQEQIFALNYYYSQYRFALAKPIPKPIHF